jgi:serine protease
MPRPLTEDKDPPMLTHGNRKKLRLLTACFTVLSGCASETTDERQAQVASSIREQAHESRWIIRFRNARSLQAALDEREEQRGLLKGTLSGQKTSEDAARLRRTIEEAQFREGADRVSGLAARHGVALTHVRVLATGSDLVDLGRHGRELAEALRDDPAVEYIEPDALMQPAYVPNDPSWGAQWHYHEATAGVNLPVAWEKTAGAGSVIAVLDTGGTSHPDLDGNTLTGYDFITDSWKAGDGNGRDSNPQDEGDFVAAGECGADKPARNSSWHATHVAGTIAAVTNNSLGVAGVAFDARVFHARVLGKCGGWVSDIADAITWASGGAVAGVPANGNPAHVINMSLGGSGVCGATYQAAIDAAVGRGTAIVVSAGNDAIDVANQRPANCNNVIAVAALDRGGNRAYYSNYGAGVDVAAPGGETSPSYDGVLSTLNAGTTTPGNSTYAYYQGTSMAAPHVAGVAALLKSVEPSLTPADIESRLKTSARPIPGACLEGCGTGLVDAAAAVRTGSVNGKWPLSGGRSHASSANPRFKLSLSRETTVQFNLTSANTDTYLYLLSASGSLMAEDDDSGGGTNSRITRTLPAGNYLLVAGTFYSSQAGDFALSSTQGDLSAFAHGAWSSSGGRNPASNFNPRFVLDIKEPSTVGLNLVSNLDTYLYVLDQSGNVLYSDDDSGNNTNSRLKLNLAAGEYVVVAATFGSGQSGSFELTSSHGVLRSAPSSAQIAWSSAGPISGQHCTQIHESSEPSETTWFDNYLCSMENYGFAWSSAGPIGGMRCTQIHESAEPAGTTWHDNYLCVPNNSPLQLLWSSAGPISGKVCVQWFENEDPHTWNDNYLCY